MERTTNDFCDDDYFCYYFNYNTAIAT